MYATTCNTCDQIWYTAVYEDSSDPWMDQCCLYCNVGERGGRGEDVTLCLGVRHDKLITLGGSNGPGV
jgi:hypothetical protein